MLKYNDEVLLTKEVEGKLYVGVLETTHIQKPQTAEHAIKGIRFLDVHVTQLNCHDIESIKSMAGVMFECEIHPLGDKLKDLDEVLSGNIMLSIMENPFGGVTLNIAEGAVFSYFKNNGVNVLPNLSAHRTNLKQRTR